MASWLDKLLGINKLQEQQVQRIEMLSTGTPFFTPFNGDAYENDIFRSAVDSIARNVAKIKGSHIIYSKAKDTRIEGDANLNRLLGWRPNPHMSAYDFLYKITTHLYIHNNAYALLNKDENGNLISIYPILANHVEYMSDEYGNLHCKFLFANGEEHIFPTTHLMILRRHFNSNDLLGDDNKSVLPALELAYTQNVGMTKAIENSSHLKGILKFTQTLSDERLDERIKHFTEHYMSMSNNGGVAPLDATVDYIPLKADDVSINHTEIEAIKTKVYDYLGIGESIVNSTYTESEWSAFYESVIEPIALQLSQELTEKIFTDREFSFGNRIIFESNRLQFASNENKIKYLKELVPMGLITINQALEILNLPPIEEGNERLQSLNYINKEISAEYQLNKSKGDKQNERV